jgi:hypothetical protein
VYPAEGNVRDVQGRATAELDTQRPVGFADIVAKVKPAVISVRVKVSGSAKPALSQDKGDDEEQQIPVQPETQPSSCYVPRMSSTGLVEIRTRPSATLPIIRR